MKKGLMTFLLLFLIFGIKLPINATGHPQFQDIIIPKYAKHTLLIDLSEESKGKAVSEVKGRFLGWSVFFLAKNESITYVGETIFARSNLTTSPLKFNYNASVTKIVERSVSTSGSAGLKLSGKMGGLTGGLDAAIKVEVGQKEKTERSEKHDFSITVYPFTKVTVNAKGDATLNNGACKYYFLGIVFKKGTWETIDVINEYYEFYEEKI